MAFLIMQHKHAGLQKLFPRVATMYQFGLKFAAKNGESFSKYDFYLIGIQQKSKYN